MIIFILQSLSCVIFPPSVRQWFPKFYHSNVGKVWGKKKMYPINELNINGLHWSFDYQDNFIRTTVCIKWWNKRNLCNFLSAAPPLSIHVLYLGSGTAALGDNYFYDIIASSRLMQSHDYILPIPPPSRSVRDVFVGYS